MGEWLTRRPGRSTPGKETRYPLRTGLGGPEDRSGRVWNITPHPPGFDPRTVQPVVRRSTDYAIPDTKVQKSTISITFFKCEYGGLSGSNWNKKRGRRLEANWNSGEQCAACHRATWSEAEIRSTAFPVINITTSDRCCAHEVRWDCQPQGATFLQYLHCL